MEAYRALYRDNRPEVFSEILGQEHIVKILRHQIATNTISHAYLFCGTRGTGKTTTARILAKAVNCTGEGEQPCGECPSCKAIAEGHFMDVMEIDAASNNGVENIRELRESVNYPPSVGRRKVYIIDEVHMLSTGAFNALLKTLEEPPENVMFILATTNPEKLPQTVLSRCMRLDFRRVSASEISENMRRIAENHGVTITEDALALLSGNADGSVRDSLSILEQCMSSGEKVLDRDTVLDFLGTVPTEFYLELTEKVLTKNISEALLLLEKALHEGKDVKQMMKDWMSHYRSLLIAKFVAEPQRVLNMSAENIQRLQQQSAKIELEELNQSIVTLARTINDARYSTQARILMEVAIVTIASGLAYGDPVPAASGGRGGESRPSGGLRRPARPTPVPAPAPVAQTPVAPAAPAAAVAPPWNQAPAAPQKTAAASPAASAPPWDQDAPAAQAPRQNATASQAKGIDRKVPDRPTPAKKAATVSDEPPVPDVPWDLGEDGVPDANRVFIDVPDGMEPVPVPPWEQNVPQKPAASADSRKPAASPATSATKEIDRKVPDRPASQTTPAKAQATTTPATNVRAQASTSPAQSAPNPAPAQTSVAPAQAASMANDPKSPEELDELWNDVFEAAEPISSTTNYMRMATLAEINQRQFKVLVSGPIQKLMLERDGDLINRLMSERLGRDVAMVVRQEGDAAEDQNRSAEEIAKSASDFLGTAVTIK